MTAVLVTAVSVGLLGSLLVVSGIIVARGALGH